MTHKLNVPEMDARDASNEAFYGWWVENNPTDHSHHVVRGTRGSITVLRARIEGLERENERLTERVRWFEKGGGIDKTTAFFREQHRAEAAEALAERERARADDHDSARQSEKERADYAEAKLAETNDRWNALVEEWKAELAAAREQVRVLREAIVAWKHSASLPDCHACCVLDAHPGSALRATPEEPKP